MEYVYIYTPWSIHIIYRATCCGRSCLSQRRFEACQLITHRRVSKQQNKLIKVILLKKYSSWAQVESSCSHLMRVLSSLYSAMMLIAEKIYEKYSRLFLNFFLRGRATRITSIRKFAGASNPLDTATAGSV